MRAQAARRHWAMQVGVGTKFEGHDFVDLIAALGDDDQWADESAAQVREGLAVGRGECSRIEHHGVEANRLGGFQRLFRRRGPKAAQPFLPQAVELLRPGAASLPDEQHQRGRRGTHRRRGRGDRGVLE